MNDGFGAVIARSGLGAEDEGNGRKILQLAPLQLIIDRENAQGIHELAFVFMQALDLDIKDHGRGKGNAFTLQDLRAKLGFLFLLDCEESPAQSGIDHRIQILQPGKIGNETRTDGTFNQAAEFGVAQSQPAALSNSVGLVLEAVRIKFVPLGKDVVFQDFRMERSDTIRRMSSVNGESGHVHTAIQNDAQGRRGLFSCFFHLTAETGIDLPDDADNLRTNGRKQRKIPFFKGFLHDGMIGVGKSIPCNGKSFIKGYTIFTQQPDQFGNGHCRMSVIQLGCVFLCKERIVISVTSAIGTKQVLHRRGYEYILLFDAQLLSFFFRVIRIKEFRDIFSPILVCSSFRIFLVVEEGKIDFMQAFGLPQTKGTDIFGTIPDDRHIIRYGQHVSGFHPDNHCFILPPNGPGISKTCPVIRLLTLTAIHECLLKEAVTETESVSGQRDIAGDSAVQETCSQAPQATVSECVILNIFKCGKIHAFFCQESFCLIQNSHTVQVVEDQAADQVFHGQVGSLAAEKAGILLLFPDRGNRIHGGTRNRVMQLDGGSIPPSFVRLGYQTLFRISDQLLCVHFQLPPVCLSVQGTVFHDQVDSQGIRFHAPGPVASDSAGIVHPGF